MIGDEARAQILEREGRLPDRVVACVGGGSNAIGIFAAFVGDEGVELVGVEAGGRGLEPGRHGAPLTVGGRPGVLHGSLSAVLQDERARSSRRTRSPPAWTTRAPAPSTPTCATSGARRYLAVTDDEALGAFRRVTRLEGIIPALETAHALHYALAARRLRARPRLPARAAATRTWPRSSGRHDRGPTPGPAIAAAFAGAASARR